MCLFVSSLNSGSNGNCYYIGNKNEAILVDAGISCREIERRLKRLHLQIAKIRAVFISHEHRDHIRGIESYSKKYQVPVYITSSTLSSSKLKIEKHLQFSFSPDKPVHVGDLRIIPFSKHHDAADPASFVIKCNNVGVGIFTDIGYACENLVNYFRECHAAFLEANYDEKMLDEGKYPFALKQRIKGKSGHLSNTQALELFLMHRPAHMSHLFLSHLSKNNNRPHLVEELFAPHAGNVKIIVASRDVETPVYEIYEPLHDKNAIRPATRVAQQLSFFSQDFF